MDNHQKLGAVLITGTSVGIGKTIALHLDRLGFKVFATVRNERDAQALCDESSGELVPVFMDVTDQTSIDLAKEQVTRALGDDGLIGLVNNAGVGFVSPLEFVPLNDLRWLFEVNVFGLLAVTQAFLHLLRQRHGRIVNISSTASIFVAPFHGPYSASKLALNGLSNALRLELKPHGVQVSLVMCGSVNTPIWDRAQHISDRVSKSFPPQALELYGERFRSLRDYFIEIGEAGVPTEAVSPKVVHALTAKRAKNTYYVGPDANFYKIADKLLFGRLRDWVVLRTIG